MTIQKLQLIKYWQSGWAARRHTQPSMARQRWWRPSRARAIGLGPCAIPCRTCAGPAQMAAQWLLEPLQPCRGFLQFFFFAKPRQKNCKTTPSLPKQLKEPGGWQFLLQNPLLHSHKIIIIRPAEDYFIFTYMDATCNFSIYISIKTHNTLESNTENKLMVTVRIFSLLFRLYMISKKFW